MLAMVGKITEGSGGEEWRRREHKIKTTYTSNTSNNVRMAREGQEGLNGGNSGKNHSGEWE